jgi:adenylate cyclase class 2
VKLVATPFPFSDSVIPSGARNLALFLGKRKPLLETEIKLPVRDPNQVERRLAQLGFKVLKPRHFESNYLFDFPDLRLSKSGRLLRLRFAAGESLLTFKGPPLRARRYGRRHEIETRVEDCALLREVLKSLELKEAFVYEKFRTVFAAGVPARLHGSPQVAFDETPMGDYLELEGPAKWIDRVAGQLGYSPRDYITATYLTLHLQNCDAQGKKPGNMVFKGRTQRHRVAQAV